MAILATGHSGWYNVGYRLRMRLERVELDVAGNRSRVRSRVWVQSSGGSTGGYYYWGPISSSHGHSIDGVQVYSGNISRTLRAGGEVLILDNHRWVDHANDGTRSVHSGATFSNSFTGSMYVELTLDLDTIPRASSISTTGSFTTGSAKQLAWSPAAPAFRHDLHYRIGDGSWVSIASNQTGSYNWTPPHSIFQGDDSTSKTVTVRLTTKASASGATIGTKTKNFTVNLAATQQPTVPTVSWSEQNTVVASKFPGQILQSKSVLKGTVSASSVLGASIESRRITVNGVNYNAGQDIPLPTSGSIPVAISVTDSRGRTRTNTATLTVRPYRDPQLTSFLARRCNPDGTLNPSGTSIRVDMAATASSVKPSSTELNKLKIVTKTRPWNGATTTRHTRTDTGIVFDGSYVIPGGANYPASQSFEVILEVTDEAHSGTVPQNIARVETDAVVMHWDQTGIGVAKYREQGALDVGPGGIFDDGVRVANHEAQWREFTLKSQLDLWNAPEGVVAFVTADNRHYVRRNSAWEPALVEPNNVLWTGTMWMDDEQTITLSQRVSAQKAGIVLAWSAYANGAGQGYDWNYVFVPKHHVIHSGGSGVNNFLRQASAEIRKYVYIGDTWISGYAANGSSPHNQLALRHVLGV